MSANGTGSKQISPGTLAFFEGENKMANKKMASAEEVLLPATKHWTLLLTLGILMVVLGTIGFFQPIAYTLATTVLFGALLLVSGGAGIATAFGLENWKGKAAAILLALLYLVAGGLMLLHPVLGALSLTLVVTAFLIASGLIKIWMGVTHREQSAWGWVVASGVLSLLLGILIYLQFPGSGLWVLGLFLAIELIFDGWALVMLAFALHTLKEARILATN
jgi:uncharacterized membrane protein HdeD (DUF308 family)